MWGIAKRFTPLHADSPFGRWFTNPNFQPPIFGGFLRSTRRRAGSPYGLVSEPWPVACYPSRVNDLAKNYASMTVEDIERLALDAKSLTPEAKVVLRLEMEKRQLPTESLDIPPFAKKRRPMPSSWARDWKNTGKGARAVLLSLAVLCVLLALGEAVSDFNDHHFADAAAFPLAIAILGFRFVIFPFRIAWAARRRGGRFNRWLTVSIIFGFILSGIGYVIWKADKPILPEDLQETTTG